MLDPMLESDSPNFFKFASRLTGEESKTWEDHKDNTDGGLTDGEILSD